MGEEQRKLSFDILCSSHLGCDTSLFQRPQQLMVRFAREHRVYYLYPADIRRSLKGELLQVPPSLLPEGLSLHTPLLLPFSSEFPSVRALNQAHLQEHCRNLWKGDKKGGRVKILWLYSPLSVHLAGRCGEDVVVYDRMDDLSAFKGGNRAIKESEEELLQKADIVFAGGRSLYEGIISRRKNSRHTLCVPSGVDVGHFASARNPSVVKDAEIAKIPPPRIGYFGAIDERLDYSLLKQLAEENRDVSFVLTGPVVKIDPEELPQAENIYFTGSREYAELPSCLACFDAGMMPFALNDATTSISPTKTLEYFASGCPVVSTPVPDVVSEFGDHLLIADNAGDFAASIRTILRFYDKKKKDSAQQFALRQSWDARVKRMEKEILTLLTEKKIV